MSRESFKVDHLTLKADWTRHIDEITVQFREESNLPFGPLDLFDQCGLDSAVLAHMLFMKRVFYGSHARALPPLLGVHFESAPDGELVRLGIPRVDLNEIDLTESLRVAREQFGRAEERYGTAGELEVRGYWMPIDVESDQGLPGETRA